MANTIFGLGDFLENERHRELEKEQEVIRLAAELVRAAHQAGIVVDIYQVADKPLMMGHHHSVVSLRKQRRNSHSPEMVGHDYFLVGVRVLEDK